MTVTISRALAEEVIALAAADPDEVCGILLGTPDRIEALLPAPNVSPTPGDSFEIAPSTLIAALRQARDGGAAVIGWYHSHPSGDPVPSARDTAMADDDGRLWIIVAGSAVRGWRKSPGNAAFAPVRLSIAPE